MKEFGEHTSDIELTGAIRRADAAAFKVLYYRYYEAIFQYLWRRTRQREIARDLTQDVFARLWQHRQRLDPARSIRAYLYRIASNLAVDALRHKKYDRRIPLEDAEKQLRVDPESEPGLSSEIARAIEALPEPLRTVFYLSRFEGLKYAEIAEALEISIKTVESRMSKALDGLRTRLKPFLMMAVFIHFFT